MNSCSLCLAELLVLMLWKYLKLSASLFFFSLWLIEYFSCLVLHPLKGGPSASGRVLPPMTGRSQVRVAVSSHCTGEGKACHRHPSPDPAQSGSSLHSLGTASFGTISVFAVGYGASYLNPQMFLCFSYLVILCILLHCSFTLAQVCSNAPIYLSDC